MRFQADADLNEDIVLGSTRLEPEVDFQTATEAGLRGLVSPEVLPCCASRPNLSDTRSANDAKPFRSFHC